MDGSAGGFPGWAASERAAGWREDVGAGFEGRGFAGRRLSAIGCGDAACGAGPDAGAGAGGAGREFSLFGTRTSIATP